MKPMCEVLAGLDDCKSDTERVNFLRSVGPRYETALRVILKHAFDPKIKFALPEGAPPYETVEPTAGALLHGVRKLHVFLEGNYPTLKQGRREQLFTELLSTLVPGDAEIVVAMKDKKFTHSSVNRKLVLKAFPGLF
jgi:hypothetical protein